MPKLIMLFFVFCAIGLISAAPDKQVYSEDESLQLFEEFVKVHNKQYSSSEEKEGRFKIFSDNLKEINELNEKSSHATFGITFFSDLTNKEFLEGYTGYKLDETSVWKQFERTEVSEQFNFSVPDKFDWRSKGVVSKVKIQGHCGTSWAFSVTGNVESINAIKSGKIVEISEQQLVDCDPYSKGCNGGIPYSALSYLVHNGAMSSQSYPYEAKKGNVCKFNSSNVIIKLKNVEYKNLSEEDMKKKLYTTGPLSIALAAKPLKRYQKGILVEGCRDQVVDHAVLLVGYGEENGIQFWLIKNSWGSSWGEEGYFRIKRGVNCLKLTAFGIFTAVI